MATLKADSPGQRIDAGDAVLEASKQVDTKAVRSKLQRFSAAHRALLAAQKRVLAADTKVCAQQAKVGSADVVQDEAVEALAVRRISDGASRTQPFVELRFDSPSVIKSMGYGDEAKVCLKLSAASKKATSCSKQTAAAADGLARAARAVQATLAPMDKLLKDRITAITARSATEQEWETAFAALKRAARAAEDDGAKGLFAALFQRTAAKKTSKKAAAAKPEEPAVK
jgi:hypothetical protein